ncbi:MAG TPA: hypothetical protein PKY82_14675 [Pyrinomonadaceae bacterium]|nr:hypothetical protein [Pyrinomonadaceae bacterium]
MRSAVFTIIFILLATGGSFSQTRKTPAKAAAKSSSTTDTKNPIEIPEKDWNQILKTLEDENWSLAVTIISQSLTKLKIENDKKQLSRLHYFYLYALSGKVSQGKMTFDELEKVSDSFIGKDFLMPPRKVLADCKKALNYICSLKDYSQTLRFTASNKAFDSIHSFEYVMLPEKFDVEKFNGIEIVLGGKLKKAEFNPKKESSWIMRLYFDNGTTQTAY